MMVLNYQNMIKEKSANSFLKTTLSSKPICLPMQRLSSQLRIFSQISKLSLNKQIEYFLGIFFGGLKSNLFSLYKRTSKIDQIFKVLFVDNVYKRNWRLIILFNKFEFSNLDLLVVKEIPQVSFSDIVIQTTDKQLVRLITMAGRVAMVITWFLPFLLRLVRSLLSQRFVRR